MFEKAREREQAREQTKSGARPDVVAAKGDTLAKGDMAARAKSVDERSAALKAQRLERDRAEVAAIESSAQFKKQPKRVSSKGKSVAVSEEARLAYEEQIRQRDERERTYLRHLPSADNKPNR